MYQDVGIADQQKAGKQGRDYSIKHFIIQPDLLLTAKRYVVWSCVLNCFILSSIPCFPGFLICYPYVLLHLQCFLILCTSKA